MHEVSDNLPLNFTGDLMWFPAFAVAGWLTSPHIFQAYVTKSIIKIHAVKTNSYAWNYWWCAIGW